MQVVFLSLVFSLLLGGRRFFFRARSCAASKFVRCVMVGMHRCFHVELYVFTRLHGRLAFTIVSLEERVFT